MAIKICKIMLHNIFQRLYNLKPIVLNFFIVIVLHTIVELGVSTYIYSWYGLAAWVSCDQL